MGKAFVISCLGPCAEVQPGGGGAGGGRGVAELRPALLLSGGKCHHPLAVANKEHSLYMHPQALEKSSSLCLHSGTLGRCEKQRLWQGAWRGRLGSVSQLEADYDIHKARDVGLVQPAAI